MLLKNYNVENGMREQLTDIRKTSMETIEAMRDIIWFINPNNSLSEDMVLKMRETATKLLSSIKWNWEVQKNIKA